MRFFVDGTTLKILLQKHDRRIPLYVAPPINTVRYGIEKDGEIKWEERGTPLGSSVKHEQVDFGIHILYETSETRPHDFRVTSELGTVQDDSGSRGVDKPSISTETGTSYSLRTTRASSSKIWHLTQKGRNTHKSKIDLRGMPDEQTAKQIEHLRQLRDEWRRGRELVPVVQNLSKLAEHAQSDPDCRFSLTAAGSIKVEHGARPEARVSTSNRWAVYDEAGSKTIVDLNQHPDKAKHQFAISHFEEMWSQNRSLAPVMENGVWTKKAWVPVRHESTLSRASSATTASSDSFADDSDPGRSSDHSTDEATAGESSSSHSETSVSSPLATSVSLPSSAPLNLDSSPAGSSQENIEYSGNTSLSSGGMRLLELFGEAAEVLGESQGPLHDILQQAIDEAGVPTDEADWTSENDSNYTD